MRKRTVRRHRRRRASAAPKRRRNPSPIRRRRHVSVRRRRSYRRNPLGGMKGMLPDLTAVGVGAVGAAVVPMLLKRFFVKKDEKGLPVVPKWMTGNAWLAAQAGGAIVLGAVVGKVLKKPRLGAAIALGGTLVPMATFVASQSFLQGIGGDDQEAFDLIGGAEYGVRGASYGVNMGAITDDSDSESIDGFAGDDDGQELLDFVS